SLLKFIMTNRDAFHSFVVKLRPSSNFSLVCFAVGSSGSSVGQGPPGRKGFLQLGQASFFVRMYMCSFLTGMSVWQYGQTLATGRRASCVSVAIEQMTKRRASVP